MKPRLLIILNRLVIGGQTFDTIPLAWYLRNDFDILILYGEKDTDEEEALFFLDKYPGLSLQKINLLRRNINPLHDIPAYMQLRKIVKTFRPDIVHTHGAKSGMLGRLAAKLCGVKNIVHTFHGHVFHSYFNKTVTGFVIKTERWLAKSTHIIIALSETQKNEIIQWLHIPAEKIKVIPLGIDYIDKSKSDIFRKNFRAKYHLADDAVAVGILGRLTYIKNISLFIDVAAKLISSAEMNNGIFFVIGDGIEKDSLIRLTKQYGIPFSDDTADNGARLIFTSWVTDVQQAIDGLDIVALTSYNEGTPMSLIEAQLCGKPVVASDAGGVADTFINNETGFLIEKHKADLFAEKIKCIASDKSLRDTMGAKARLNAEGKFSKQMEVQRMQIVYNELMKLNTK